MDSESDEAPTYESPSPNISSYPPLHHKIVASYKHLLLLDILFLPRRTALPGPALAPAPTGTFPLAPMRAPAATASGALAPRAPPAPGIIFSPIAVH